MAFIVRDRSGKVIGSTKLRSGATVKVGGSSRSSGSSSSSRSRGSSSSRKSKSSTTPKTKLVGTTKSGKRIYERDGEKYTIDQSTGKSVTYTEPSKKKPVTTTKDVFKKARGGQSFLSSRISTSKGIESPIYKPITFEQAKEIKDKPKSLKEAIKREETRRMVFTDPGKSSFYQEVEEAKKPVATKPTEKSKPVSSVFKSRPLTEEENIFRSKIAETRKSQAREPSFGSVLTKEAQERYAPFFDTAKFGLKTAGKTTVGFFTKPRDFLKITGKEAEKSPLNKLKSPVGSIARASASKGLSAISQPTSIFTITGKKGKKFGETIDPEIEKAKQVTKSDWEQYRKGKSGWDVLREEYKAPGGKEKLASSVLTATELFGPEIALSKIPRVAKTTYYKGFGKFVEPEAIYSTKALESPLGLDTSYSPSKTLRGFSKSQAQAKGTAFEDIYGKDYLIGTSSAGEKLASKKVKSKIALGEPVTETGGLFISPLGAGQPRFLRLGKDNYTKFSLDPFKSATTETPQSYIVGVRDVKEFPSGLLRRDKDVFSDIEAFQKSRVGRAEARITREASLGIKKEPEAVIGVGEQFGYTRTGRPLYTTISGKTVPVRTIKLVEDPRLIKPDLAKLGITKTKRATKGDISRISGRYYEDIPSSYVTPPYGSVSSALSSAGKSYESISSRLGTTKKSSPFRYVESTSIASPSYSFDSGVSGGSSTSLSGISPVSTSSTPSPSRTIGGSGSDAIISDSYSRLSPSYSTSRPLSGFLSGTSTRSTRRTRPRVSLSGKDQKDTLPLRKPYKIQIKSEGKWINVRDRTKRNYYNAWNRAARLVDSYKERSFRLRPGKGNATRVSTSFSTKKNRFYQPGKSRSLKGAFIEKSKYAIDSYNELKGITYKGIQAQKRKRSIF